MFRLSFVALLVAASLVGCTAQNRATSFVGTVPHYVHVTHASYAANAREVVLNVQPVDKSFVTSNQNKETVLDTDHPDGVINYATTNYPNVSIDRINVLTSSSMNPSTLLMSLPVRAYTGYQTQGNIAKAAATLPPGVRMDTNLQPIASRSAARTAKVQAILQVANSKLGTPYIWGHSEDRGQRGFDCSNFTAYVYHHALGYIFSGASRTQYASVGTRVSVSSMLPGDLLCFNGGSHVGIYAGNGQMIQEGGGLAKVGYLPLRPGSYWYTHISAVKRMF